MWTHSKKLSQEIELKQCNIMEIIAGMHSDSRLWNLMSWIQFDIGILENQAQGQWNIRCLMLHPFNQRNILNLD